jgi:hypothetical protein
MRWCHYRHHLASEGERTTLSRPCTVLRRAFHVQFDAVAKGGSEPDQRRQGFGIFCVKRRRTISGRGFNGRCEVSLW